jgi:nucleoid DNA-binding protein
VNRVDLAGEIAEASGLSVREANAALIAALAAVAAALARGEEVSLHGFGSFQVRQRQERDLIHPRTKERVRVAPAPTVHFAPAAGLRRQLTGDR